MRKGIIDRFEGEYAVVEFAGETEDILKSSLPHGAKTGDTLIFEEDQIKIDKTDTENRRKEIDTLIDELFED